MRDIKFKYFVFLGALVFIFGSFIACGAQLYQVSMHGDFDDQNVPEHATDPRSTLYGIHALGGWRSVPIPVKFGSALSERQRQAIIQAMRTWELAVGRKLFLLDGTHSGITGDSFVDLYSSLDDSINGYYLDKNWQKTQKPATVLATTVFSSPEDNSGTISAADIRFNEEYYILDDSLFVHSENGEKEVADLQSVALHELGHFLGLAHVSDEIDPYSIMNPKLFIGEGLTSRKISRGDITRIQQIYGCQGPSCDIDALVESIELSQLTSSSGAANQSH